MKKKSMAFAIKALLCVGAIAVCFIIYTLTAPVAMTEQQTATLKRQSKDSTQSAVATKSRKKSCGCCEERMERLRQVLKQQAVAPETESQEVGKKPR
ncbi:MAG: hypothetical protein OXU51_09395 [Candidatus Poribacteria bacterium]|nr:hypothetical protein [Candidatus Poribacteria bacterium]